MARLNTLNSPQGFKQLSDFSQSMAKPSVLGSRSMQPLQVLSPRQREEQDMRAQTLRNFKNEEFLGRLRSQSQRNLELQEQIELDKRQREEEVEQRRNATERLKNLYNSVTLFGPPSENQINQLRDSVQRTVASGVFGDINRNFFTYLGGPGGFGQGIQELIQNNISADRTAATSGTPNPSQPFGAGFSGTTPLQVPRNDRIRAFKELSNSSKKNREEKLLRDQRQREAMNRAF